MFNSISTEQQLIILTVNSHPTLDTMRYFAPMGPFGKQLSPTMIVSFWCLEKVHKPELSLFSNAASLRGSTDS